MFPLSLVTYGKMAIGVVCLLGSFYFGWHLRDNDYMAYKATIVAKTATAEKEYQAAADQIRKDKDAKIAGINNQLADAISELRKRPSRAQSAANGQGGTGATLSAEDAEFLTREAARADIIRTGLSACYQQYDALNK
jgi:hypothetical protein